MLDLLQEFLKTGLPDVTGAVAGRFGVAVLPWALRNRARAAGQQLVPEIAGETSRAVWRKNKLSSTALGGEMVCVGCVCRYASVLGEEQMCTFIPDAINMKGGQNEMFFFFKSADNSICENTPSHMLNLRTKR